MLSKFSYPYLLTQAQSKYLLQNTNAPSFVTILTFRLQKDCNEMFKRIFIAWYFKKEINMFVDRFYWGVKLFLKKAYCFSSQILLEATIESFSVRGDHAQKASRRTKLIFVFYNTYPPQKCRVNVIHDTIMLHENHRANFCLILPRGFGKRGDI